MFLIGYSVLEGIVVWLADAPLVSKDISYTVKPFNFAGLKFCIFSIWFGLVLFQFCVFAGNDFLGQFNSDMFLHLNIAQKKNTKY